MHTKGGRCFLDLLFFPVFLRSVSFGSDTVSQTLAKAKEGDAEACCCLAFAYETGAWGLEVDQKKAAELYGQATESKEGCVEALFNLALMHRDGRAGEETSAEKAKFFMTRAAEQGCDEARCWLAAQLLLFPPHQPASASLNFFSPPCSSSASDEEARQWLLKCTDSARAANNMGCLFAQGRSVAPDLTVAKNWFLKAAQLGDEAARLNLSLLEREEEKKNRQSEIERGGKKSRRKKTNAASSPVAPEMHLMTGRGGGGGEKKEQSTSLSLLSASCVAEELESKAHLTFAIYDREKRGSMTEQEFVACWSELSVLDSVFSGQNQSEANLQTAFGQLCSSGELGRSEFVSFYQKAAAFTLSKTVELLVTRAQKK